MRRPYHIYGLFDSADVCFYVGQTQNLRSRMRQHRKVFSSRIAIHKTLDLAPDPTEATLKENAWMRRFLNQGLKLENKMAAARLPRNEKPTYVCLETGELFYNMYEVAEKIGRSATTVKCYFEKSGSGNIYHETEDFTLSSTEGVHFAEIKPGMSLEPVLNYQI